MSTIRATIDAVLSAAEAAFARGAWSDAIRDYLAVLRSDPRYAPARFRIADALLNLDHPGRAAAVYRGLAWHHIRSGRPLSGLVATKMLLALEPRHEDLLTVLAELYSAESDRTGDVDAPPPFELSSGLPAAAVELQGDALLSAAATLAAETEEVTDMPVVLPPIPLFSHLETEAFRRVLESLRLRRYAPGEVILREGDVGTSFFMLAEGEVEVGRGRPPDEVVLARLHRGTVFGEMALVSRAPRAATVRALGEVDALEIDRADLEAHAGQLESVKTALRRFTRGRLLANLAATSPLFESLSRADRRTLIGRFRTRRIFPGDVLIERGERGRGLFLIVSGRVSITVNQAEIARLSSGEVFGEISLLEDVPTTATVTALDPGEVLYLSPEEVREVLATYPAVAAVLRTMTAERLAERRPVGSGDGAILI